MMENKSEVARLRQQIANEYQAAAWGLSGLAYGTAQHRFITAKMERMGQSFTQLTQVVGSPETAIELMNETLDVLPEKPTRFHLFTILRHELGTTEETEMLLEHIQETWETIDLLRARFGSERAQKILDTPSSLLSEEEKGGAC